MRLIRVLSLPAVMMILAACAIETPSPATPTVPPTGIFTPIALQPTATPVPPPPSPTPAPAVTAAAVPSAPASTSAAATATTAPAGVSVAMVDIPAGSFTMGSDAGSPESKPAHPVDVAAFKIDKFEVTNADFTKFVAATQYKTDAEKTGDAGWSSFAQGKDNHPVVKVSRNDAVAFCTWASKRLPTEAEWEKAARGTDGRAYPWGNDWDPKKANVKDSGIRGTTAAGSYPAGASALGVMDLAGNVWEWTADIAKPYPGAAASSSKLYGPNLYIIRGGGWFDVKDQVASFYRNSAVPTTANDDLGFRCAK